MWFKCSLRPYMMTHKHTHSHSHSHTHTHTNTHTHTHTLLHFAKKTQIKTYINFSLYIKEIAMKRKTFTIFYRMCLRERIIVPIRRNACSDIGAPTYGYIIDHTSELRRMAPVYGSDV